MAEIQMPGAAGIKRRDLHFFWVLDRSASMTGEQSYVRSPSRSNRLMTMTMPSSAASS